MNPSLNFKRYKLKGFNLHSSINLHRAPGFCIKAGFHEPYNLWKDQEASDAFYWHWHKLDQKLLDLIQKY